MAACRCTGRGGTESLVTRPTTRSSSSSSPPSAATGRPVIRRRGSSDSGTIRSVSHTPDRLVVVEIVDGYADTSLVHLPAAEKTFGGHDQIVLTFASRRFSPRTWPSACGQVTHGYVYNHGGLLEDAPVCGACHVVAMETVRGLDWGAKIDSGVDGTTTTDRMKHGVEAGVAPGANQDARPGDLSKVGDARV